jgi:hypothetical protein
VILTQTNPSSNVYSGTWNPSVSGTYEYYASLWQPGGLTASYFLYTDFTQLIDAASGLKSRRRFESDGDRRYTRIDPNMNFNWGNSVAVDGVSTQSVQWEGRIDLSNAATLVISGTGQVKVYIDSALGIDTTATPFVESIVVGGAGISSDVHYIVVEYLPPPTEAQLALKYTTASGNTYIVSPTYLSAEQSVSGFNGSLVVSAGGITTGELNVPGPVIIGSQSSVYFIFEDAYGNIVTTDGCDDVTLSVLDINSVSIPDAFGSNLSTLTIPCNSLIPTSDGNLGSVAIYSQADFFQLSAAVTPVGGGATVTISATGITVLTPYSST